MKGTIAMTAGPQDAALPDVAKEPMLLLGTTGSMA
jgi:hypothetical protein